MSGRVQATYRIQLHGDFDFDAAAQIADYLARLGVSHVYCSPYLQAAPGSTHGYDVVDHGAVNAELGGEKAHRWFCRRLGEQSLGQVVDVVPNHMAISGPENRWWWDVLENGPSSRYASYFDVDWSYAQGSHGDDDNRILLPILGDHYGRIVEAGQIRLERRGGSFVLRYFDHVLPVDPRSISPIIARAGERCDSADLGFVASALDYLPLPTATDRASTRRRHRDKEVIRTQLARLLNEQPLMRRALDEEIEGVNSDPDRMDALLARQNYRPAFWRVARSDLGYRRFFDINDLVGLCAEDGEVFLDTHALILQWLSEGVIDGLRIDHPDGLRDPQEYLTRLRDAAPESWIVVEKILEPGERLRPNWPVQGTTGYDFMFSIGQVLLDARHAKAFDRLYHEFVGADEPVEYHRMLLEKKELVVTELLGSDMNRLAALAAEILQRHRRFRDYTRDDIHQALMVLVTSYPVYRTYVRPGHDGIDGIDAEDVRIIDEAVATAQQREPEGDGELLGFLGSILKLEHPGRTEAELATRMQQVTAPVMAKGAEDTAFYCYTRFAALNEVGGDPSRFGISVEEFHRQMQQRAENSPDAMLSSSTHDTKRSEDVRARLAVLSEIPDAWAGFCDTIRERTAAYRHDGFPDGEFHDPETEYLLYQTIVGAWPIDHERLTAYLEKAIREAKRFTFWTRQNEHYESAVREFVNRLLTDEAVLADIEQMVQSIDEAGKLNSLSQTLIKLTAPGVPDTYQGNELWDYSLVDPDNRRPVDYDRRRALLEELAALSSEEVIRRTSEGLPKLLVTARALQLRRRRAAQSEPDGSPRQDPDSQPEPGAAAETAANGHPAETESGTHPGYRHVHRSDPEGFGGSYQPVAASGARADHVVAFLRGSELLTVAVRLPLSLAGEWADTETALPKGRWTNVFTGVEHAGGQVRVAELLRSFPVALLERREEESRAN